MKNNVILKEWAPMYANVDDGYDELYLPISRCGKELLFNFYVDVIAADDDDDDEEDVILLVAKTRQVRMYAPQDMYILYEIQKDVWAIDDEKKNEQYHRMIVLFRSRYYDVLGGIKTRIWWDGWQYMILDNNIKMEEVLKKKF